MYGAILGDMIGAPNEFDRGNNLYQWLLLASASKL